MTVAMSQFSHAGRFSSGIRLINPLTKLSFSSGFENFFSNKSPTSWLLQVVLSLSLSLSVALSVLFCLDSLAAILFLYFFLSSFLSGSSLSNVSKYSHSLSSFVWESVKSSDFFGPRFFFPGYQGYLRFMRGCSHAISSFASLSLFSLSCFFSSGVFFFSTFISSFPFALILRLLAMRSVQPYSSPLSEGSHSPAESDPRSLFLSFVSFSAGEPNSAVPGPF